MKTARLMKGSAFTAIAAALAFTAMPSAAEAQERERTMETRGGDPINMREMRQQMQQNRQQARQELRLLLDPRAFPRGTAGTS